MPRTLYLIMQLALLLAVPAARGQVLQFHASAPGGAPLAVGDTLSVDIRAHLGELRASGAALFLRIPAGLRPLAEPGGRPFRPGLFAAGHEFANEPVPETQTFGQPPDTRLLAYAVVLGPGPERHRSGTGVLASVSFACVAPVQGRIELVSTAAHASMLVLDDGCTELGLRAEGLEVRVSGPALRRAGLTWGRVKASRVP